MNEYKKFSYYYDEAVSNMNYRLWVDFLKPYLKPEDRILDLACGSGTLAILLKMNGYQVEGLDLSSEIIEIAKEKAKINHLDIPFYIEDMTNFSLNKTYDVITCFFDSVNFLKTKEQIDLLFKNVKRHLKPNGLFILDVFSKKMLHEYWYNKYVEKNPTYQLCWKTTKVGIRTLKHRIKIKEGNLKLKETYYEYYHKIKSLNSDEFKLLKNVSDNGYESSVFVNDRVFIVLQTL